MWSLVTGTNCHLKSPLPRTTNAPRMSVTFEASIPSFRCAPSQICWKPVNTKADQHSLWSAIVPFDSYKWICSTRNGEACSKSSSLGNNNNILIKHCTIKTIWKRIRFLFRVSGHNHHFQVVGHPHPVTAVKVQTVNRGEQKMYELMNPQRRLYGYFVGLLCEPVLVNQCHL